MQKNNSRKIIWIIGLVVVAFIGYVLILTISRAGETKVTIRVAPETSQVFVDGKPTKSERVYLGKGEHKFKATLEGFSDDEVKINTKDTQEVILLPKPTSDSALNFLEDNPAIQSEREALGGQKNDQIGQEISENNPLLSKLPVHEVSGPFSIDYSLAPSSDKKHTILISNSSPKGRANAVTWIKAQGYNPSELLVEFVDFNNPLTRKDLDD